MDRPRRPLLAVACACSCRPQQKQQQEQDTQYVGWLLLVCAQSKQRHTVAASRNHTHFAAVAKVEAVLEVLGHTYCCAAHLPLEHHFLSRMKLKNVW
jgi:hypothetical protein